MTTSTDFLTTLHTEAETLTVQFPALASRLAKAAVAIEQHRVFLEDDGHTAMVQSKTDADLWYHVNGSCPCKASQNRSEVCYHRLAARLYQKVCDRLEAEEERYTIDLDEGALASQPTIKPEWLVSVQGKPFIRFEGLLELAHARGLVSLETVVVQASEAMCICQATATFADGRRFTDIGDATERNVAKHLDIHYIRMAATRASARALRRALNISACSVEELSGEEVTA